jgi:hypothetical protein
MHQSQPLCESTERKLPGFLMENQHKHFGYHVKAANQTVFEFSSFPLSPAWLRYPCTLPMQVQIADNFVRLAHFYPDWRRMVSMALIIKASNQIVYI